jgi:hypothetical protein
MDFKVPPAVEAWREGEKWWQFRPKICNVAGGAGRGALEARWEASEAKGCEQRGEGRRLGWWCLVAGEEDRPGGR